MKTKHYHNTINAGSDYVQEQVEVCKTQEETIFSIFKKESRLTPSKAWKIYEEITNKRTPITSIRRAISNLSRVQMLYKTNETQKGIYGKPEHVYVLCVPKHFEIK
mgnify:CR=1 FL=1